LWKFYQSKQTNSVNATPSHLLLSPNENFNLVNFTDFNKIGLQTKSDATSFKKIQYFTKTNPQMLFNNTSDYNLRYNKLADLYFNESTFNDSNSYGTYRQHNYTTSKNLTNTFSTKIDGQNVQKYLDYNFNFKSEPEPLLSSSPYNLFYQRSNNSTSKLKYGEWDFILKDYNKEVYKNFLKYPLKSSLLNSEIDGKHYKNMLKHSLNSAVNKKSFIGEK
jgi:hypothetical protein